MNPKEALSHIKKLAPETISQSALYNEAISTLTALVDDHEAMLKRAEEELNNCQTGITEYSRIAANHSDFRTRQAAERIVSQNKLIIYIINYILKGDRKC